MLTQSFKIMKVDPSLEIDLPEPQTASDIDCEYTIHVYRWNRIDHVPEYVSQFHI